VQILEFPDIYLIVQCMFLEKQKKFLVAFKQWTSSFSVWVPQLLHDIIYFCYKVRITLTFFWIMAKVFGLIVLKDGSAIVFQNLIKFSLHVFVISFHLFICEADVKLYLLQISTWENFLFIHSWFLELKREV
jgi:hypothetical protein